MLIPVWVWAVGTEALVTFQPGWGQEFGGGRHPHHLRATQPGGSQAATGRRGDGVTAIAFGLTALVPEGVAAERARSIGAERTNYVPETGTASISLNPAFICDCPSEGVVRP